MDKKETILDSLNDAAGSLLWFLVLFGLLIGAFAIAWHLFKWVGQAVEWSMTTRSPFRWLVLCPVIIVVAPFMFVWFAIKQAGLLIFRLILRIIMAGRWLIS